MAWLASNWMRAWSVELRVGSGVGGVQLWVAEWRRASMGDLKV